MAAQRALMAGKYKPLPESLSGGARRIIQGLLVVDPQARMDLEVRGKHPCHACSSPHLLNILLAPMLRATSRGWGLCMHLVSNTAAAARRVYLGPCLPHLKLGYCYRGKLPLFGVINPLSKACLGGS